MLHPCLKLPDIVGRVCFHLHPTSDLDRSAVRKPMMDLAIVARTCVAFHSPALDYLWRSATLINLLRCLPSDLVVVEELAVRSGRPQYTMRILRPIRVSDWERVLVYAHRVKRLFSDVDDLDLSAVFPCISLCVPENLLQNLRSLHWQHGDNDFHYIHFFLSSKITALSIHCTSYSARSLLPILALKCPRLRKVFLGPRLDSSASDVVVKHDVQAISTFVRGLRCIEKLSAPVLDQGALEHLRRLPTLRQLDIGGISPTLSDSPTVDSDAFVSLEKLQLSAEIEATTRFLGWCNKVPLIRFGVLFPAFATADETHCLFTALAVGLAHSSVTDLTLDSDSNHTDLSASSHYPIRPESIRVLLCFVNLTAISILSPVGIDLDNDTVAEMARAWPGIESLELASYRSTTTRPRISLGCLLLFATYCRHMRRLVISFDGTVLPTPQLGAGNRSPQHSLKHLDVEYSAISTPISVAGFLSGIFPRLEEISSRLDDEQNPKEVALRAQEMEFHDRWNEVQALLPHLAAIRADERNWLQSNPGL
ncbi:hypothetical protein B0H13DRAFT_1698631 [Mycena leptocephala]|nr:hypothetical protein B0H13DRAFT_1698631 [Mycena leptocephala]